MMKLKCLVCGEGFESNSVICTRCNTPHHEECFNSTGCSIYGCGSNEYYLPKLVNGNLVGIEKKKANITSLIPKKESSNTKKEVMLETIITPLNGNYANDIASPQVVQINSYIQPRDNPDSIIDKFIDGFEGAKLAGLDFDRAINYSFDRMHIHNDAICQSLWNIADELNKKWESYVYEGRDGYTIFGLGIGVAGGLMISRFIEYYCGINIEPIFILMSGIISATIGYNSYPLIDNRSNILESLYDDKKRLKNKYSPKLEYLLKMQDSGQKYTEIENNLLLADSKDKNDLLEGKNN